MCTEVFVKFAAIFLVYLAPDLLRQELITQSAPGNNLLMHFVREAELSRLRKEVITVILNSKHLLWLWFKSA